MPSPTEAALTEILREFGLPACNEDVVAAYMASRGAYVRDPDAVTLRDALFLRAIAVSYRAQGKFDINAALQELADRLEGLARGEAAA